LVKVKKKIISQEVRTTSILGQRGYMDLHGLFGSLVVIY